MWFPRPGKVSFQWPTQINTNQGFYQFKASRFVLFYGLLMWFYVVVLFFPFSPHHCPGSQNSCSHCCISQTSSLSADQRRTRLGRLKATTHQTSISWPLKASNRCWSVAASRQHELRYRATCHHTYKPMHSLWAPKVWLNAWLIDSTQISQGFSYHHPVEFKQHGFGVFKRMITWSRSLQYQALE